MAVFSSLPWATILLQSLFAQHGEKCGDLSLRISPPLTLSPFWHDVLPPQCAGHRNLDSTSFVFTRLLDTVRSAFPWETPFILVPAPIWVSAILLRDNFCCNICISVKQLKFTWQGRRLSFGKLSRSPVNFNPCLGHITKKKSQQSLASKLGHCAVYLISKSYLLALNATSTIHDVGVNSRTFTQKGAVVKVGCNELKNHLHVPSERLRRSDMVLWTGGISPGSGGGRHLSNGRSLRLVLPVSVRLRLVNRHCYSDVIKTTLNRTTAAKYYNYMQIFFT